MYGRWMHHCLSVLTARMPRCSSSMIGFLPVLDTQVVQDAVEKQLLTSRGTKHERKDCKKNDLKRIHDYGTVTDRSTTMEQNKKRPEICKTPHHAKNTEDLPRCATRRR